MRHGLFWFAIVACAQQPDSRGFVNERLLRQNFAKNALAASRVTSMLLKPGVPRDGKCAIPLLTVRAASEVDPKMALPLSGRGIDEKMILPAIPVCPSR